VGSESARQAWHMGFVSKRTEGTRQEECLPSTRMNTPPQTRSLDAPHPTGRLWICLGLLLSVTCLALLTYSFFHTSF